MKVTIRRADLVEALDLLKEMCPARFLELERGALMTVSSRSVTLEVTDEVHWGKVTIERVTTEQDGVIAVDPKLLSDLVKKMESLEVELMQDRRGLRVEAAKSKYILRLYDPDLHPGFPSFPVSFSHSVGRHDFRLLCERIATVAQADKALANTPHGVWLCTNNGKLKLYTTDGIRLVHGAIPVTSSAPDMPPILLGHHILKRVASLSLLAGSDVNLTADESCMYIRCGNAYFVSPLLTGSFSPYYETLETKQLSGNSVEIETMALADAVDRLLVVADVSAHCPIAFHAQAASCVLTTETETGDAEETVTAKRVGGSGFRVLVNGRSLFDALSKMKAQKFTIAHYGARLPLCLIPSDQPDLRLWLFTIMP